MRRRRILSSMTLAVALIVSATSALAVDPNGFTTEQDPMLDDVMEGVEIAPIITVGDELPNGYRFESIPDGISVRVGTGGQIELFVNHETSKVPFPFNTAAPTEANGESDFDNAQVSLLTLDPDGSVLDGSFVIPSSEGLQRFCSNYLATAAEGFDRDILFTNEESPDYVFRQEDSWPPPIGDPAEEENGLVVALDVESGELHLIYGMGRHNHENAVPIPGFDKLVVLSGDDTFTSGSLTIPAGGPLPAGSRPAQSQLYSYIAGNTNNLLADKGNLWAFVSDDPNVNDYYDFTPGSTQPSADTSSRCPRTSQPVSRRMAPRSRPPTSATRCRPRTAAGSGTCARGYRDDPQIGIDGPQWVLEYWSQLNNVFQFVRVEDLAYDKRPGMENVVYVVDSGRGTAGDPQAGRLDERSGLEDGARPGRPEEGRLAERRSSRATTSPSRR